MKKLFFSLLLPFLVSSQLWAEQRATRLSKKDRQDLVAMFTEFLDGMERSDAPIKDQMESRWWFWESPMMRIEKSIDQLNEMAQQINNYIVDVSVSGGPEKCDKILKHLEQLELLMQQLVFALEEQQLVLGNLDDESVGEQDFNSVSDIDEAQLSLVSWLKTVYREQLKDKFIS